MKTQLLKKLSLLLCALLFLTACSSAPTSELQLAPQKQGTASTLFAGLQWGMSYEEAAKVLDFERGRIDKNDLNTEYVELYPSTKKPDAQPYTLFGCNVEKVTLSFFNGGEYEDITAPAGLYKVEVSVQGSDAQAYKQAFYDAYGTGHGNVTQSYLQTFVLQGELWDCYYTDMVDMTQRQLAVARWLQNLSNYQTQQEKQTALQSALAAPDTVVQGQPNVLELNRAYLVMQQSGEGCTVTMSNYTAVDSAIQNVLTNYK